MSTQKKHFFFSFIYRNLKKKSAFLKKGKPYFFYLLSHQHLLLLPLFLHQPLHLRLPLHLLFLLLLLLLLLRRLRSPLYHRPRLLPSSVLTLSIQIDSFAVPSTVQLVTKNLKKKKMGKYEK